jgi:hypothetical protein
MIVLPLYVHNQHPLTGVIYADAFWAKSEGGAGRREVNPKTSLATVIFWMELRALAE